MPNTPIFDTLVEQLRNDTDNVSNDVWIWLDHRRSDALVDLMTMHEDDNSRGHLHSNSCIYTCVTVRYPYDMKSFLDGR